MLTRLHRDQHSEKPIITRLYDRVRKSYYYFGKMILPGVKIINVGNEAVQLSFMKAHREGKPCPPQINIDTLPEISTNSLEWMPYSYRAQP